MILDNFFIGNTEYDVVPINHASELYDNSNINYKEPIEDAKAMAQEFNFVLYVDGRPANWTYYGEEKRNQIRTAIKDCAIDKFAKSYYKDIRRYCKETITINGETYTGKDLYEMGYDITPFTMFRIQKQYEHELKWDPSLKDKDIRTILSFYVIKTHYSYSILRGLARILQ